SCPTFLGRRWLLGNRLIDFSRELSSNDPAEGQNRTGKITFHLAVTALAQTSPDCPWPREHLPDRGATRALRETIDRLRGPIAGCVIQPCHPYWLTRCPS